MISNWLRETVTSGRVKPDPASLTAVGFVGSEWSQDWPWPPPFSFVGMGGSPSSVLPVWLTWKTLRHFLQTSRVLTLSFGALPARPHFGHSRSIMEGLPESKAKADGAWI